MVERLGVLFKLWKTPQVNEKYILGGTEPETFEKIVISTGVNRNYGPDVSKQNESHKNYM